MLSLFFLHLYKNIFFKADFFLILKGEALVVMIKDERGERSERIFSRLKNYCFVDKFIHKTST
jgi:hypothetical protein